MQGTNLIKLILPIIILPPTIPERSNGVVRPNYIKTALRPIQYRQFSVKGSADFMDGFENSLPNSQ